MEDMLTFVEIVIIAFGIIQLIMIIKFFQIEKNIRCLKSNINISDSLFHEALVFHLKGNKQTAYDKLKEAFIHEIVSASMSGWSANKEDDYQDKIQSIFSRYKPLFEKLGLGHPDYSLYDKLEKVRL